MKDPLSYERIRDARETLTAAFVEARGDFYRAVDPSGTFVEAKRNLGALVQWRFGEEAFERMLNEDS